MQTFFDRDTAEGDTRLLTKVLPKHPCWTEMILRLEQKDDGYFKALKEKIKVEDHETEHRE